MQSLSNIDVTSGLEKFETTERLNGLIIWVCNYRSLLEAAGASFLRISLIMYRGIVLIATMTAVFQAKPTVTTKDRSGITVSNEDCASNEKAEAHQSIPVGRQCL